MRVFLDANVLFSACRSAGAIRGLLEIVEQRGHRMVADGYVAEEARRNLASKSAAQALPVLEALLARIELVPVRAVPADRTGAWPWLDAKDQPVLWAAVASGCDALVTGDRTHFGSRFGTVVDGVRIVSPAQLFESITQDPTP